MSIDAGSVVPSGGVPSSPNTRVIDIDGGDGDDAAYRHGTLDPDATSLLR